MKKTRAPEWPDDFVIQFVHDDAPGSNTLRVSTAQHAFHLVVTERDHLWTVTRAGVSLERRALFEAAVAEGMEPNPWERPPFDFQEALRKRYGRWPL